MKLYSKFYFIELFYVLYLISGYLKSFFIAFNISTPIDITLVFSIILVIYIFRIGFNKYPKKSFTSIILLILFSIWMLFTSIYTESISYWYIKYYLFFTNILSFVFPLISYKYFNIKKFINIFIISTTVLNTIFIVTILPFIYINDLYHSVSGQYLAVAVFSGINILFLITLNIHIYSKTIELFLLVINFITLISSGGRGGLIFTFLILFIYYLIKSAKLYKLKVNFIKIARTFLIISLLIPITFLIINNSGILNSDENLITRSLNRLELIGGFLEGKDAGKSVDKRVNLIRFSVDKISNDIPHFLFGYGIGSFMYEYKGVDERGYPHNIILEILFEMGMVGLILFLCFFLYVIFMFRKKNNFIFILLFLILNLLKSSGLTDIRVDFAIFAIYIIYSLNINNFDLSYEKRYRI